MCKIYTDIGGINKYIMVCSHVREIIHSPKLVGYLHVQADKHWYMYNYFWFFFLETFYWGFARSG